MGSAVVPAAAVGAAVAPVLADVSGGLMAATVALLASGLVALSAGFGAG